MKQAKRLWVLFFFALCLQAAKCQQLFHGILIDSASKAPIEGSHILNFSQKTMAVSNHEGKFSIQAQAFDTLMVSNVNYERKAFIIKSLEVKVIYLKALIIQLEEVEVSNIPDHFNVFRNQMKGVEQQRKPVRLFGVMPAKPKAVIPPLFQEDNSLKFWEYSILPPSSFDIYLIPKLLSRDYKAKMKYYALQADTRDRMERDKKFNRALVKQIVGLEGNLLSDFIEFLQIEDEFIQQANEYEIVTFIKRKYDDFMNFGE